MGELGVTYVSELRWAASRDRACVNIAFKSSVLFSNKRCRIEPDCRPVMKASRTDSSLYTVAVTSLNLQSLARVLRAWRNSSIVSPLFCRRVASKCRANTSLVGFIYSAFRVATASSYLSQCSIYSNICGLT